MSYRQILQGLCYRCANVQEEPRQFNLPYSKQGELIKEFGEHIVKDGSFLFGTKIVWTTDNVVSLESRQGNLYKEGIQERFLMDNEQLKLRIEKLEINQKFLVNICTEMKETIKSLITYVERVEQKADGAFKLGKDAQIHYATIGGLRSERGVGERW